MKNRAVFLLGGTSDAIWLAKQLIALNITVTYSIAGLVRQPELNCNIHCGGFHGEMTKYLHDHHIDLLIDATHPYAINISQQAVQAAKNIDVEYWLYNRPAWQKTELDHWIEFTDWDDLVPKLHAYQTPFFTLGREPLKHLDDISEQQYWTIRTAIQNTITHPKLRTITEIGGFSLEEESALFVKHNFDVLICKNSGGESVASKLLVARNQSIPVLMQARPVIVKICKIFTNLPEIVYKLQRLP